MLLSKIVSAHGNAVTRGQRPADRRTDAREESDSRAAWPGYGSLVVWRSKNYLR